jgi:hypothetical protein
VKQAPHAADGDMVRGRGLPFSKGITQQIESEINVEAS